MPRLECVGKDVHSGYYVGCLISKDFFQLILVYLLLFTHTLMQRLSIHLIFHVIAAALIVLVANTRVVNAWQAAPVSLRKRGML